jgi:hypothetical protein
LFIELIYVCIFIEDHRNENAGHVFPSSPDIKGSMVSNSLVVVIGSVRAYCPQDRPPGRVS